MTAEGQSCRKRIGNESKATSGAQGPGEAGGKPDRERSRDQVGGDEHVHRQQEHETAQASASQVGKIDTAKCAVALQEDAAEEDGAGQERRELREEHLQKLP